MNRPPHSLTASCLKRLREFLRIAPLRIIAVLLFAATISLAGLVAGPTAIAGAALTTATQIAAGPGGANGITVDSYGDLFMIDATDNSIIVVTNAQRTIFGQSFTANVPEKLNAATGLDDPNSIGFDSSGNLYITNWNGPLTGPSPDGYVTVVPAETGSLYGHSVTADTAVTLIASLLRPTEVAFDDGDLLVSCRGLTGKSIAGYITVLPSVTGTLFGQSFTANDQSTLTVAGLNVPNGLAIDSSGDLFISNATSASTGGYLTVLSPTTTSVFGQSVTSDTATTFMEAGASQPTGLSFDSSGNLYIANEPPAPSVSVTVVPVATGTLFGQAVTADTQATLKSTVAGLTGIVVDQSGNLYISSSTAATSVVPAATGTLFGQSVTANDETVLAVTSGINVPQGITTDSAGDVFLGNTATDTVSVVAATSGTIFGQSVTAGVATVLTAATGLADSPVYLAYNAGDLFISESASEGSGDIQVIAPANSTIFGQSVLANTPTTLEGGSSVYGPEGMAFDSSGDLFMASEEGSITVLPAASGTIFGQSVTANAAATLNALPSAPALRGPRGIAFDSSGNLFIAVSGSNDVEVLPAASGTIFGQSVTANTAVTLTAATGLSNPQGVAVGATGNLYIADNGGAEEMVIPPTTGTLFGQSVTANTTNVLSSFSSLVNPIGVAVNGNSLYVTEVATVDALIGGPLLVQGSPTTTTVANSAGYTGNLSVTNEVGTITYGESTSKYSSDIMVNSSGAINYDASALSAGTYTVSGTDSDTDTPSGAGTWSFTLSVSPPALLQDSPTSATVANNAGYTGNLSVTNGVGAVSYVETTSTYSGHIVVSSSGAITYVASALPTGVYTVSGTDSDTDSDTGAWSITLTVSPAPLVQGSPTTTTVAHATGYTGNLSVTNGVGAVSYVETTSTYSGHIVVSSSGAITYVASALPTGVYTVSGTDSDTDTPSGTGTWSFTLTVSPTPPPTSGASVPAPPPTSATVPASAFGAPTTGTASSAASETVTATSGDAHETVTVPAGALPGGTSVSVYPITDTAPLVAQVPTSTSYVLAFGVSWETPTGSSPAAATPITATINDPSIVAGDTIFEVTPSGLVAVGTASTNGTVTITFSSDPTFVITHVAAAARALPRATKVDGSAVIGKTVTLTITGSHFYAQPSITSNESGTRAVVSRDTGTLLTVRVTVSSSGRRGEHIFTVRLANGASCTVRYSVK